MRNSGGRPHFLVYAWRAMRKILLRSHGEAPFHTGSSRKRTLGPLGALKRAALAGVSRAVRIGALIAAV